MTQQYRFRAMIENAGDGGAYVNIPFDVEMAFGKKHVKIKATFDGEPDRGTLARMGGPQHILLVLKKIHAKIGKSFGNEIIVELGEDLEPRQVEVPSDLQGALVADPKAHALFNRLSYSHQKEYIAWITEAKRDQTRNRRIQQTLDMLKQGKSGH